MDHTLSLDPSPRVGLFMPDLWAAVGGEDLTVSDATQCHQRLMAATGLPARAVACPLWASCAVPLLSLEQARVMPVDDQILGHPFLWMPNRLLTRFELVPSDGSTQVEGRDVWVARVLLEAIAAGWYERVTGRWIDVLADVDRDSSQVRSWLAGEVEDPLLEGLEAPISSDTQWAIEVAQGLIGHLRAASDALAAAKVAAALRDDDPQTVQAGALAAGVIGVVDGRGRPSRVWEQLSTTPSDAGLIAQALTYLDQLREAGEESLDQLAEIFLGPGGIDA